MTGSTETKAEMLCHLIKTTVKIVEIDEKQRNTQLEGDVGSAVSLLNKFTIRPEDINQFQRYLPPQLKS
jgi:hypothetical protein